MKITFNAMIKDLIALLAGIFTVFIFLGAVLVYSETDSFSFHWSTLKHILSQNIHYLLFAIVLLSVSIFFLINYFLWVLSQRKNCQIQYVDLSHIATKWLEYNDVEKNIRDEISSTLQLVEKSENNDSNNQEIFMRLLDLGNPRIKDFVREFVIPKQNFFDAYETKIVFDLLQLLDTQGEIPSVASLYSRDPEIQTYKDKAITMDGKTSYDILSEYTLIDHTIRVAETMLSINASKPDQIDNQLMYSRMIISALAHDIGKIKAKEQIVKITGEMYHKTPHDHISAMMFQELYPDYRFLKTVLEAIRSHHLYKVESTIASLLKEADKKAREIEIGDWLIRRKESNEEVVQETTAQEVTIIETPLVNTKEKKVPRVSKKSVEVEAENEPIKYEFDFIEAHLDTLIMELREKINEVEPSEIIKDEKIISVNFGNQILYDYMFFKKTLEVIMKSRLTKENILSIFEQLKNYGLITMVEVEKGFMVSRFIVQKGGNQTEVSFVPVNAKLLGIAEDELEESKRAHPILRNVVVMTYKGVQNQMGAE